MNIELRQAIAKMSAQQFQQQEGLVHYRFQQMYYDRLRQQQARLPDGSDVTQDGCNHHFRNGFQRGYEDGYCGRRLQKRTPANGRGS